MVITHPDKVLFPDDGITKGELAAYYEIALMLPHLVRQTVTMERVRRYWSKGLYSGMCRKGFPTGCSVSRCPGKTGIVRHP